MPSPAGEAVAVEVSLVIVAMSADGCGRLARTLKKVSWNHSGVQKGVMKARMPCRVTASQIRAAG